MSTYLLTRLTLIISLTNFSFGLNAQAIVSKEPLDLKRIEAVADSIAHAYVSAGITPGMNIAIARDGNIILNRGYGKADVEMNLAAGPETVYGIGSITKQITAAIIMRLVEAGKISLEDPITEYLPDYPVQGHQVAVYNLLNHTSGIPNFTLQEDNGKLFERDLSYEEIVDRFGREPFNFKPVQKHAYNNFAFYLLGEIISRVTGMSYENYVEQALLQSLGLKSIMYCEDSCDGLIRAKGYKHEDKQLMEARHVSMKSVGAAGSLCSTAGELTLWTHLLHSGKVVSESSLRQMITPTVLSNGDTIGYGYGLFLGELSGHKKIYHGGRGVGFLSLVTHYPEDGLTIAVLMNAETDRAKRDLAEETLARAVLGIVVPDLPLMASDITCYKGIYHVGAGEKTTELYVFGENGKLKAQIASGSTTQLRFQGEHTFLHGENDNIQLIFTVEDGQAQGVRITKGDQVMIGRRKE